MAMAANVIPYLVGLKPSVQLCLGAGTILLLGVGIMLGNPLLGFAAVIGLIALIYVVKDPFYSVVTLIAINVLLSIRPKEIGENGAPSLIDFLLGLVIISISVFWIVKLRFLERQYLTRSTPQLLMLLFLIWSCIVTVGGIIYNQAPPAVGLREILNLAPLFILPMIYERGVIVGSKRERKFFLAVIAAGLLIIIASIFLFRRNIAHAVYIYQTGRAALDLAASTLITVATTSLLMTTLKKKTSLVVQLIFTLSIVGLAISLTRTLYVGVFLAIVLTLFLGNRVERANAVKRLSVASILSIIVFGVLIIFSRLLRLLSLNFLARFISTRKGTADISLRDRLSEWSSVWSSSMHSPIFGFGFGARFRFFDVIGRNHAWSTFSHNSYLYILFKTGIVGFLLFILANVLVIWKGFAVLRSPAHTVLSRAVTRTALVFTLLVLFGAYTGPTFDSKIPVTWLALAWGYIYAIEQKVSTA